MGMCIPRPKSSPSTPPPMPPPDESRRATMQKRRTDLFTAFPLDFGVIEVAPLTRANGHVPCVECHYQSSKASTMQHRSKHIMQTGMNCARPLRTDSRADFARIPHGFPHGFRTDYCSQIPNDFRKEKSTHVFG